MKARAIIFAGLITLGSMSFAHAAEVDKTCSTIAKVKAAFISAVADYEKTDKDKVTGIVVTSLSPGQFNWLRGYWMGSPPQLAGQNPGNGAVLFEHKGDKGGLIVWTLGTLACHPAMVPPEFIAAMRGIKTSALGPDGDEL